MKKKIFFLFSIAILLVIFTFVAHGSVGTDSFFSAGTFFRKSQIEKASSPHEVAAVYKETKILFSAIEYNKKMNFMRDSKESKKYDTDHDIINRIVENIMLVEEAEKLGLSATNSEIEEMVNAAKLSYEIPEGKELLDQYCKGAEISIEEYYEILRAQAPSTIARQKLKDYIGKEYCIKNGIKFTKVNPSPDMVEAVDQYIQKLFDSNKKHITYYID